MDDDGSVPPDFLASGRLASAMRGLGTDLIGTSIGVYHITALMGVGGMGEVYRARDSKLGREVAIKILPGLFNSDPDRLTRFEREARVLALLNHPHIGTMITASKRRMASARSCWNWSRADVRRPHRARAHASGRFPAHRATDRGCP